MKDEQTPYAAKLTDSSTGTDLLLAENGRDPADGYLIAALAPFGFAGSYDRPDAPPSITLPPQPDTAAHLITDQLLPTYHQVLYARQSETVTTALDALAPLADALTRQLKYGPTASRPDTPATLAADVWTAFLPVLVHAPGVLTECAPAVSEHPADTALVNRLGNALQTAQTALDAHHHEKAPPAWTARWLSADARAHLAAETLPSITTWLHARDDFVRIARTASPTPPSPPLTSRVRHALPGASPSRPGPLPDHRPPPGR